MCVKSEDFRLNVAAHSEAEYTAQASPRDWPEDPLARFSDLL